MSNPRKVFLGGLSWDTTDATFRAYFEQFGTIEDSILMRKPNGGSRGFGFVTFVEEASVDKVMNAELLLDGRKIESKRAIARSEMPPPDGGMHGGVKKIFVGGLTPETTQKDLEHHFASFGKLTEVLVMQDKDTGRSRGFAFVTFENPESVDKVCNVPPASHTILGKIVECKRAIPKEAMQPTGWGGGRFGYGGRGGYGPPGRGGFGGGFGYGPPQRGGGYPGAYPGAYPGGGYGPQYGQSGPAGYGDYNYGPMRRGGPPGYGPPGPYGGPGGYDDYRGPGGYEAPVPDPHAAYGAPANYGGYPDPAYNPNGYGAAAAAVPYANEYGQPAPGGYNAQPTYGGSPSYSGRDTRAYRPY